MADSGREAKCPTCSPVLSSLLSQPGIPRPLQPQTTRLACASYSSFPYRSLRWPVRIQGGDHKSQGRSQGAQSRLATRALRPPDPIPKAAASSLCTPRWVGGLQGPHFPSLFSRHCQPAWPFLCPQQRSSQQTDAKQAHWGVPHPGHFVVTTTFGGAVGVGEHLP